MGVPYIGKEGFRFIWAVLKNKLSEKANLTHTHKKADITDFPAIDTTATSNSSNLITSGAVAAVKADILTNVLGGLKFKKATSAPTSADENTVTFVKK